MGLQNRRRQTMFPYCRNRGTPVSAAKLLTTLGAKVDRGIEGAPSILLADDEDMARLALRARLEQMGMNVTEASDGAEACEALSGRRHFDLVITDLRMPKVDGFAVLQKTLELGLRTPVIMLTAYAE